MKKGIPTKPKKKKKKNQKTADAAILISDNSLKARNITKNKEDKYLYD